MSALAYLTDVEGQWNKVVDFARENPLVTLEGERLTVREGAVLVFGGDAIDRGPDGRRVVATLLDAWRRQPDQVVLIAGNRDVNKMRLVRELGGFPPPKAPEVVRDAGRAELLRWIFTRTMGAHAAFENRRAELANHGEPASDAAVVDSFMADLAPGGPLHAYLSACRLAYRSGPTLFVHGAVTGENLGVVPGRTARAADVDAWVAELNEFYAASMEGFARGDAPAYAALVAYQAPVPGTRENRASVVYARPEDALGTPRLPPRAVVDELGRSGVERLLVGHTPSGDCPAILRSEAFTLVLADNSYGREESGSRVLFLGDEIRIEGATILDGGERAAVSTTLRDGDTGSPLGKLDRRTGRLVKARLARGDYLLYRTLGERHVEQVAVSGDALDPSCLVTPWP